MNKLILKMISCCLLMSFMDVVLAASDISGIGTVAQNLMGPVGLMSNFVYTGCIVIGASFLFASIIKFNEYRRSPLMVPIGKVWFLVFAGIFLILLPFAYLLTQSGIPFYATK